MSSRPLARPLCVATLLAVQAGCRAKDDVERHILGDRTVAARLSGQTAWSPCVAVDDDALVARTRCGSPTERALDQRPPSGRLQAIDELRWHATRPTAADRAVAALESALVATPRDHRLLNDLAAAQLVVAERDQQLMPLLRALESADRAIEADSTMREARFNRALLLERLHLLEQARSAWRDYVKRETLVTWRREGEQHVASLDALARRNRAATPTADSLIALPLDSASLVGLVRATPQWARETGIDLLGAWGDALVRGDSSRATTALALATIAGRALALGGGDDGVASTADAIARARPHRARLAAAARGLADYRAGYAAYIRGGYGAARQALDRAERTLRAIAPATAGWAELYGAVAAINDADFDRGDSTLVRLTRAPSTPPLLHAKALWVLGLSQVRRGAYERAADYYRAAMPAFVRAGERESAGMLSMLLAEASAYTGQTAAARAAALRALVALAPYRQSRFLTNDLGLVATLARAEGLERASLDLMGEVIDANAVAQRPQIVVWGHGIRARGFVTLGRRDEAAREIAAAESAIAAVPTGLSRDLFDAEIRLARAQLVRDVDPRAARDLLIPVVATFRAAQNAIRLPVALLAVATASRDAGEDSAARPYLEESVATMERRRVLLPSPELRATFYEASEATFDALMKLELDEGRAGKAFDYLERARAAAWSAQAHAAAALSIDDVRRRVAPRTATLAYAVLDDRLVVWAMTRAGWRHREVRMRRDSLAALVARFGAEASIAETGPSAARAALFDLLVRPELDALRDIDEIAVVPDRELSRVPFAALFDRETRRYVVEDRAVRTLPNATFVDLPAPRAARPVDTDALIVGDPAFDVATATRVSRLPGAAREAISVAASYRAPSVLTGSAARRDSVLALLPTASIFHFAGHAIANVDQPELSYLLLAGDGAGTEGVLSAREIGALRLSRTRLVVLSACSTLGARATHVGALAGLAYSFLRAGVPATVSSLWDVDDAATTPLLVSLHRHVAAGQSIGTALRAAQLDALQSSDAALRAPRAWAAFIYTGP